MGGDFNDAIVTEVAHRPWPMPDAPWLMTQTWHDLLFAHWPVDVRQLRPLVPRWFELDLFDNAAWIGVVPFRMTNVAPRGVPALPWVSAFAELNVRTYVRADQRPGVFFFSLDAASALAVRTARALLNLPYYTAAMTVTQQGSAIDYFSRRQGDGGDAALRATYQPVGDSFTATPGSLDYFLTERYCLYHLNHRGVPYRLEIHHPPWPLQRAEAEWTCNTMTEASGITRPDIAPLLHFAKRQDMVGWGPVTLDGT